MNFIKTARNKIIKKIADWYLKEPIEIYDPMEPWEIGELKIEKMEKKLQKKYRKLTHKYNQEITKIKKKHMKTKKKILIKYGMIN